MEIKFSFSYLRHIYYRLRVFQYSSTLGYICILSLLFFRYYPFVRANGLFVLPTNLNGTKRNEPVVVKHRSTDRQDRGQSLQKIRHISSRWQALYCHCWRRSRTGFFLVSVTASASVWLTTWLWRQPPTFAAVRDQFDNHTMGAVVHNWKRTRSAKSDRWHFLGSALTRDLLCSCEQRGRVFCGVIRLAVNREDRSSVSFLRISLPVSYL